MTDEARWPIGPFVVLLAGTMGTLLSLHSYFAPLTGVTGTPGALLVIGSSVALVIDALILWGIRGGAQFWVFWTLGVLGALSTISAGLFLHLWWFVGASLVILVGLIVTLTPRGQTKGAPV